jgi:hypothetical protein
MIDNPNPVEIPCNRFDRTCQGATGFVTLAADRYPVYAFKGSQLDTHARRGQAGKRLVRHGANGHTGKTPIAL